MAIKIQSWLTRDKALGKLCWFNNILMEIYLDLAYEA